MSDGVECSTSEVSGGDSSSVDVHAEQFVLVFLVRSALENESHHICFELIQENYKDEMNEPECVLFLELFVLSFWSLAASCKRESRAITTCNTGDK